MIICGHQIEHGEKKRIAIAVPDANPIEAFLFCGAKEGRTLAITAGVHGCEYVGIETAHRLSESLDPALMRGNVILLPLINAGGFLAGAKQVVPEDGANLNRVFPGEINGTLSRRMSYLIEHTVFPYADFLIDLHGGDCNESLFPLVFHPGAGSPAVNACALEAARSLSVRYLVRSTSKNGLYSWAVQRGVPALLIERGSGGSWSEEEVARCTEDVMRIMSHLDIIDGDYPPVEQVEISLTTYLEAEFGGFWYPEVTAGQHVRKGDLLGTLRAYPNRQLLRLYAQSDGVVLYYTTALGVRTGDPLVAYGIQ